MEYLSHGLAFMVGVLLGVLSILAGSDRKVPQVPIPKLTRQQRKPRIKVNDDTVIAHREFDVVGSGLEGV